TGRSVLVQLCGVGAFVVFLLLEAFVFLLEDRQYNVWIGPPIWEGPLAALVAWAGMLAAGIALILPSTRRALAGPDGPPPPVAPVLAMADTGFTVPVAAADPPRSLRV